MIDPFDVVRRVFAGFETEPDEPPTARTTPDGSRGVGMLHVPGVPGRGLDSWATVEASSFETPYRTPDGQAIRVEFVAAADAQLTKFGDTVAACAFALGSEFAVKPGTVYRDAVARTYPAATTPHLFSVDPFAWEGKFHTYVDDEVLVTWLQLVPITEDEAVLVAEHGEAKLTELFMRAQPDLFAIDRASVLTV